MQDEPPQKPKRVYKKKAEEQPVAAEEIKQTEPNLMAKKMFKSNISRRQNSSE